MAILLSVTGDEPTNSCEPKIFDLVLIVANKSSLAVWPLVLIDSVYSEPVSEFTNVPYLNSSSSGLNFIAIWADSVIWPEEFRLVQNMLTWSELSSASLFLIIFKSLKFLGMVESSVISGSIFKLFLFSYISEILFCIISESR